MDVLTVRERKTQKAMLILLCVLLLPLAAGGIAAGGPMGLPLGAALLGVIVVVAWLQRRARGQSVRLFSAEGVERFDGQRLPWSELERVVQRTTMANGTKELWRTEIRFRDGRSAWIVPLRVQNRQEVMGYVNRLPCEHTESPA